MNRTRFLLAIPSLLLCSCASIMNPGPYLVPISSKPPGATVLYRGAQVGTTPCQVGMDAWEFEVTLRREGCHDRVADVGHYTNGWFFGNILFGGVIGVLVDLTTGNMVCVDTDPVEVDLAPTSGPNPGKWTRPAIDNRVPGEDEGWITEPRGRM